MKTYNLTQYLWLLVKRGLRRITLTEAIIALAVLILLYVILCTIELAMENILYLLLLYLLLRIAPGSFTHLRKCITKLPK